MSDDQPHVDFWPTWDEPLSKVTAPVDIEQARYRLARRFNTRSPAIPPAVRDAEIDRAWDRYRRRAR